MRNLRVLQDCVQSIDSQLPLTASAWDTKNDALIFTLGPAVSHETIELRRTISAQGPGARSHAIASWDAACPLPDLAVDRILDLHYFPENGTISIVLEGGDLILIREEPLEDQSKIEIVGSVDGGIAAAAWSPDEELLAIATKSDTFLFMTIDFDNVASISLSSHDAKLSRHVSVGWGKAETQFKGKRARALRDPTMPEKIDEGVLSPFDQNDVTISWRGDGSFVALNSIIGKDVRRMIRIFDREGKLDSVTEPVDGLEGALSWRPAGNLISAVQRQESEVNIVFFERNGLRHGSFPLRISKDQNRMSLPISLTWNVFSSVLAVAFPDKVQLWTMGNYHYYLKQEFQCEFNPQGQLPLRVNWHPEDALKLSLSAVLQVGHDATTAFQHQEKGIMRCLLMEFVVSSGSVISPMDFGTVAVIDGCSLKITPLRKANVPPPMALHEVEVECTKDIAINSTSSTIATLHEHSFSVIQVAKKTASAGPVVARKVSIPKQASQITQQICFCGDDNIFVLLHDSLTGTSSVYDDSRSQTKDISNMSAVSYLVSAVNNNSLYLLEDNYVYELRLNSSGHVNTLNGLVDKSLVCEFPVRGIISKIEVLHRGEEAIAFGLSTSGTLFANERQVVKGCISFVVTTSHLIFTTANHLLKFVHMANVADLEVPPDEPEVDERCRSIERGAKIVTVMPTTFSLVLQMPRGNLETIYPRALVLASIRSDIEARKYRSAFLTCRSQRVDMNILHDHAPKQFLAETAMIVDQLKEVDFIDLFLSQLREEDVSQRMYRETIPMKTGDRQEPISENLTEPVESQQIRDFSDKVNNICDAFLLALRDRITTNLQNVITAHVCKLPPDIESGLEVIAGLRNREPDAAERATEHICFLVDVNKVYDCALGLYDLDLALLVAQQSQKDPREYLPYLQGLQELPALRKQFAIDNDLGRHIKALGHLKELKDFEEVKSYTQKHELYKDALDLYRYETQAMIALTRLYADFLVAKSTFKDAAIAYESIGDYSSSCTAYRSANLWEECLSSAALVPMSSEEIVSLAKSLAETLVSSRDFHGAGLIQLDYLSDIPSAVSNFCRAHRFSTAIRTASRHSKQSLLSELVDPGLVEASASLTELLAECKVQMGAQVPRLHELRKLKASDPLSFFDGDGNDPTKTNGDIPDDISLAPSANSTAGGASLFTRYTQRSGMTNTIATGTSRKTSKNRRREERKRARGKKGSVYEEEYLVNSIGRLIERVNETAGDVRNTTEALLRRNMRERARAVEEAMVEVVEICAANVGEVFEAAAEKSGVVEEAWGSTSERPPGADGVLWDSLEQSKATRAIPVVKAFERSSFWT